LIGAGLTSLLAIAAIFATNTYGYYQNGQIKNIDCLFGQNIDGEIRDFNYYSKAVENRGLATDQYCLAELIKSGNGTQLSLEKARNLYKSAIEQGLTLAKIPLCQPAMFEQKFSHGHLYSEFRSLCCLEEASFHKNHACPWYKDSNSTS